MEERSTAALTNLLEDKYGREEWTYDDLLTRAEQVEELDRHPGMGVVRELLAELREATVDRMRSRVHEQAGYAQLGGFLNGIEQADAAIAAVLDKAADAKEQIRQSIEAETASGRS